MATRRHKNPVVQRPTMHPQDKALTLLRLATRDFLLRQDRYTYASLVSAVDAAEQRNLRDYFSKGGKQ